MPVRLRSCNSAITVDAINTGGQTDSSAVTFCGSLLMKRYAAIKMKGAEIKRPDNAVIPRLFRRLMRDSPIPVAKHASQHSCNLFLNKYEETAESSEGCRRTAANCMVQCQKLTRPVV